MLDRLLPRLNNLLFSYRPFTPPTSALTSLQSSLSSVNNVTTSGIAAGVDPSYSPNSPSHLPTSTVKIKSGKPYQYTKEQKRNENGIRTFRLSFFYSIKILTFVNSNFQSLLHLKVAQSGSILR